MVIGDLNVLALIVAGFVATAIMQAFLFFFGLLTGSKIRILALLGTLATKERSEENHIEITRKTIRAGMLVFYAFGLLFAFLYTILWNMGIGQPKLVDTFIFGCLTGILILVGLNFLLRHQSSSLKVRLTDYFSPLLIGSVIYAINFLYFYTMIT